MFYNKKKKKRLHLIPKLLVVSFMIITCTQAISALFLSNAPELAFAKTLDNYTLQIPIGDEVDVEFKDFTTRPIAEYIKVIYKYAVGVVGIIAAVVLMIGGVVWLTAGGNATQVGEAKAWIGASLTGMVLVLASYMILYQVNPDLIAFKPTDIKVVDGTKEKVVVNTGNPNCKWTQLLDGENIKSTCRQEDKEKPNPQKDLFCGAARPESEEGKYATCCCAKIPKECIKAESTKCTECEGGPCLSLNTISVIKCKNNKSCKTTASLKTKLTAFRYDNKVRSTIGTNWQITEAWPPTTDAHSNNCHYNGTCVDFNLTGSDYHDTEKVVKTWENLTKNNLKAVYETKNNCKKYEDKAKELNINNFVCESYTHITGQHFSVYD